VGVWRAVGDRRRSSWDDTVAIEVRHWRWGRMMRERMKGVGLMETKVSAGLTGGVSNRRHGGKRRDT
jgi:hypothetical protein